MWSMKKGRFKLKFWRILIFREWVEEEVFERCWEKLVGEVGGKKLGECEVTEVKVKECFKKEGVVYSVKCC